MCAIQEPIIIISIISVIQKLISLSSFLGITHKLTGSYTLSMTLCAAFWGVSAILFFFVYLLNRRARAIRKRLSSNSKVNELKKEPLPLKDIRKDQIVSASYSPLPTKDMTTV